MTSSKLTAILTDILMAIVLAGIFFGPLFYYFLFVLKP
jgi:hypothetical protein